jgi:hypothetical protein
MGSSPIRSSPPNSPLRSDFSGHVTPPGWRRALEMHHPPTTVAGPDEGLPALAAEFPTALDWTVGPRLLTAAVLVIGSARRLRRLAVEGFTELALGVVLCVGGILRRLRFGHSAQATAFPGACRKGGRSAMSAAPADPSPSPAGIRPNPDALRRCCDTRQSGPRRCRRRAPPRAA